MIFIKIQHSIHIHGGKPTKVVYNSSEEGKLTENDPKAKNAILGVHMNYWFQ